MERPLRSTLWRHRNRLLVAALVVLVIRTIFGWTGALSEFLGALSWLVVMVASFLVLRWLIRRFFFKVSRRLGVAFVFIGGVPLFLFAVFVLAVFVVGTLSMVTHDAGEALDKELVALTETARVASFFARTNTESDATFPVDPSVSIAIHLPGDGPAEANEALPEWVPRPSYSGVVAIGDSLRLVATREEGGVVTIAYRRVDDALAERLAATTGFDMVAVPFDRKRQMEDEVALATTDSTMHVNVTLGEGSSTSMIVHPVVEWASGDTLFRTTDQDLGRQNWPLYSFSFTVRDYIRARAGAGVLGSVAGQVAKWTAIVFAGMIVVAVLIGIGLTSSVTRAVNALHKGTRRVAEGNLDHRIRVRSKDQLGALAASFNEMSESVSTLLETKAEKERLDHEMQIAAQVQQNMLPTEFPSIPGLDGAATSVMAKHVGGDLYDFIRIGPNRVAIVIGDVSGKGVSAALVMSNVISAIRSMLTGEDSTGPADVMIHLNDLIYRTTAPDCFVTMFYAEYDMRTGTLTFANAGHDWPMVVSRAGDDVVDLPAGGVMLGAFPDLSVDEKTLSLSPGDVIVAYSDGLVDTVDAGDRPFERERVRDVVTMNAGAKPAAIVQALEAANRRWRGEAPEVDDVTIVVLKRVPLPGVDAGERVASAAHPA